MQSNFNNEENSIKDNIIDSPIFSFDKDNQGFNDFNMTDFNFSERSLFPPNSPFPSYDLNPFSNLGGYEQEKEKEGDEKEVNPNEIDELNNKFEEGMDLKSTNIFKIVNDNEMEFEENVIKEEEKIIKKEEINEKRVSDPSKKTFFTSKETSQISPNMIIPDSSSKEPVKRIDYSKKFFKSYFSNYIKETGNKLIQTYLPSQFKNIKIFSPNHKSFTGNSNIKDNYQFLFFSIKDILCYYKNENCQNSLQKKNKSTFEKIFDFIDECEDEKKYENIKSFFNMNLEDAYKLFYESKYFKKYASDEKVLKQDKEFIAQNGFSLLEKNAFIKMVKLHALKKLNQ